MSEIPGLPDFKSLLGDKDFDEIYNDLTKQIGLDLSALEKDVQNMSSAKVTINYITETGKKLSYNYDSDSGFDLYSSETITIEPFGRALVPTGIKFEIPADFEIQIRPKSGLALNHGLTVLNTPGTIDEGYTGEVKVIVFNTNPEKFTINAGMKIAQAVVARCVTGRWVNLIQVNEINKKDRGENGFGSTGI
jgi:dUTP pyrophosphatase